MKNNDAVEILEVMAMAESTFSDEESKKCCEAINLAVKALKRMAYAYQTYHIDREAWEPCERCKEPIRAEPYAKKEYPGICDFEVILDGGDEITVNAYNHYTPVTEEICFSFPVSFCPTCGRRLRRKRKNVIRLLGT